MKQAERGEGYRYASYFPPAIMVGFPFLFIFTAAAIPAAIFIYIYIPSFCGSTVHTQGAENDRERHRGRGGDPGLGGKGMEESLPFPPDILRHFVSNPKVEGVGASPGIGPYSTFMALNRDEVSTKLPSLPTFFSFFPSTLSHPFRSFDAYTRFFFETGMPRSENDLSLIYSLYSFIYLRRRARV